VAVRYDPSIQAVEEVRIVVPRITDGSYPTTIAGALAALQG
jgi:hypothetical protein